MKRILALVIVVVMCLCGSINCAMAQAAEIENVAGEITVREISKQELEKFAELAGAEQQVQTSVEVSMPEFETKASYAVYEYSQIFSFYDGDVLLATAEPVCTVWRYTDGKVHLYNRTITMTRYVTGIDVSRVYGSIVNTDGSLSYTSGDRVMVARGALSKWFALDFYITPNEVDFSCYEL